MVSIEKCYTIDNIPTLHTAIVRGEYLYQVRLYEERFSFQSVHSANMRMRMLLGFIEAKAVVVDALIKTDGNLQYLSVLCSSPASPQLFSKILNSISRRIIIEELERSRAEEFLSTRDLIQCSPSFIPFSKTIQSVNESKKVLFSLLLEYRALLAEFASTMPFESKTTKSIRTSMDFTIPFIVFEKENTVCAIPEFQVASITHQDTGAFVIICHNQWNESKIISEDILCIKELDITQCLITGKRKSGFYTAKIPVSVGDFFFTLVVPSFLE
ncbi:MAG TPA: hypothetical protein VJ861_11570 [Treponemataceae bacterium]|nr:hypothetical protein [Treponemataceae bacterium]